MAGSTFQPPINLDPNQDPSQQTSFINQNFQSLAASLNPYIVSDGTTNRIILGKQTDGTYGLKVSQVGVDVGTATNSQLIFNSSQDMFKIVRKISATIPSFTLTYNGGSNRTSGSTTLTVAHGQSYTPIVNIFAQANLLDFTGGTLISSSYIPLPIFSAIDNNANKYYFPTASSVYLYQNILFAVDSTNIYIQAAHVSTGDNHGTMNAIPVTIFILQETAT